MFGFLSMAKIADRPNNPLLAYTSAASQSDGGRTAGDHRAICQSQPPPHGAVVSARGEGPLDRPLQDSEVVVLMGKQVSIADIGHILDRLTRLNSVETDADHLFGAGHALGQ